MAESRGADVIDLTGDVLAHIPFPPPQAGQPLNGQFDSYYNIIRLVAASINQENRENGTIDTIEETEISDVLLSVGDDEAVDGTSISGARLLQMLLGVPDGFVNVDYNGFERAFKAPRPTIDELEYIVRNGYQPRVPPWPIRLLIAYNDDDVELVPSDSPKRIQPTDEDEAPQEYWRIDDDTVETVLSGLDDEYDGYATEEQKKWQWTHNWPNTKNSIVVGQQDNDLFAPGFAAYIPARQFYQYTMLLMHAESLWTIRAGHVDPIANPTVAMAVADVKRNAFENYGTFIHALGLRKKGGPDDPAGFHRPFSRHAVFYSKGGAVYASIEYRRPFQDDLGSDETGLRTVWVDAEPFNQPGFWGPVTEDDKRAIRAYINERRPGRDVAAAFVDLA